MSISLQKGQKVSLTKESAGLSRIVVGLGWDEAPRARGGLFAPKPKPIDCDASAIMLQGGKLRASGDVIYFANLRHKTGTVQHMGDNLTGAGGAVGEAGVFVHRFGGSVGLVQDAVLLRVARQFHHGDSSVFCFIALVVIGISSGGVQHLLQLHPAGGVFRRVGRGFARTIGNDVVEGVARLADIRRDIARSVVLIGSNVHRAVLHTVGVFGINIRQGDGILIFYVKSQFVRSGIDGRDAGKQSVWILRVSTIEDGISI